jgi:exonuclease SbcC
MGQAGGEGQKRQIQGKRKAPGFTESPGGLQVILKKVDIRDFRSHEHTVVDFEEGISVIVGENGSGKTSILESVNFALFKQKPNVNMDDLIRLGAKSADVSVTFESGGRTFRATRGRKMGKAYGSSLYRIDDGEELLVKGEDEITKEIEAILGIGGELFTSAVYIKQGEIDMLVSEQAAKRKEHVGKLLGADELERAHQGMGEITKEYRIRAEGLKDLPRIIRETEDGEREKKEGIKILKHDLKTSSKVSASLRKELKEIQAVLLDLERIRTIDAERAEKEIRLKNLQENIEKIIEFEHELKKTERFHDKYKQVEREIKSLGEKRERLYRLQERGEGLKDDLKTFEENISKLENTIEGLFNEYSETLGRKFHDFEKLSDYHKKVLLNLETGLEKIDKKIADTLKKISRAEGQNNEIEKATSELEKAGAKCPVCQGALDKKHKRELQIEYRQNIDKNLKDVEKWESELDGLRVKEEKHNEAFRKTRDINLEFLKSQIEQELKTQKSIRVVKSSIKSNEQELKEFAGLEKSIKKLEDGKRGLEKDNERYIAAKSYLRKYLPEKDGFRKEAKAIERQILKLAREAKKLGGPLDVKKFKRTKQTESELQERFRDAKITEGKLESDIKHMKTEISELEKRLLDLKSKEKEREKLAGFITLLEDIRRLFHKDSLQRELRTKARPLIESYTKEIFDMFELPYNDLELTDDFNVVLFGPHGEENVDMLSGGERIAAALALRMGIAKALSGSAMELIILDEPTIHLDAQRRQDLVEIIKRLSSIPQTIVVTHDKEFETAADRLIVVEKVGGISKVS